MSDQNNTDDLLQSLASRASDQPVEQDDSPPEDIDAFLADLEGGAQEAPASTPSAPPASKEPDPFADAFASLDGDMGDLDDDPELAAKLAALAPPAPKAKPKPTPKPTPKPEPVPEPLPPTPEARTPATPEEPAEKPPEGKKARKKEKKKKDKELVKVVETQRSAGFRVTMGVLKWSAIFTPVIIAIWALGAFLSAWFETGWLILALSALPMLIAPLIPKILLKRGRWWHWAVPLSLVAIVGLVAPMPATAGRQMSHYGHWPSSTVAQLADFQADSAFVRSHAFVAELVGEQVIALAPPETPLSEQELLARALGSETELVSWATAQRKAAEVKEDADREKPAEKDEASEPEEPAEKEEVKKEEPAAEKKEAPESK